MDTVPIGGKEFEIKYSRSAIKDYISDIYGLLLDFDLPEANFSVDDVPVQHFDDRLEYCIALSNMLLSLTVNGIQSKDYNTIDPDYVDPLVNSFITLLADTVQAIEDEMEENDRLAEDYEAMQGGEFFDAMEYSQTHISTFYERYLEDIIVDSYSIFTMCPKSSDIRLYHAPMDLDIITSTRNSFVQAKKTRDELKRVERGNINMNIFLCSALELGLDPTNEVFRDLYDCLNDFGYIDSEQVKLHEDKNLNRSAKVAKADFLRSRYKQLKKKGLIPASR